MILSLLLCLQDSLTACCVTCRYNKGELEGKNVNCLMPQPFSMRHNSYLNNYITTGHAKLLDVTREVSMPLGQQVTHQ
jgi:hypothetical protein